MAIEVEVQRKRVSELMDARDATVHRLSDAYESLRQKMAIIESLEQEPKCSSPPPRQEISGFELSEIEKLKEEIESLQGIIKDLRDEIMVMKANVPGAIKPPDPPPQYDENYLKVSDSIFPNRHSLCSGSSRTTESRTSLSSF
jgi:hypothetical protein